MGSQVILQRVGIHFQQLRAKEIDILVGQLDALDLLCQVSFELQFVFVGIVGGIVVGAVQQIEGNVVVRIDAIVGMNALVYQCRDGGE